MGGCSSQLEAAKKINAAANLKGKHVLNFGATAGIGEALALRCAQGGANVTIVGRNDEAGKRIVDQMKTFNPHGKYNFVKADLTLLQNCKKVCVDYAAANDRLDYVIFTQTKATLQGRTETKLEGIDEKLGLNFYSRIFMTNLLLPLLRKTADSGSDDAASISDDVRVMSVLAAGVHKGYQGWKSDTRLSAANYSSGSAADCATSYNDLCLDKLARSDENKGKVTFIHAYPGFVSTSWGTDMPAVIRGPIRILQAVGGRAASDCAEFMLRALVEPQRKNSATAPGVNLVNEYGEATAKKTDVHSDEAMDFVWNDTLKLFDEVEKRVSSIASSQ